MAYELARVSEGVPAYSAPSFRCYHPKFLLPLWFHARAIPSWPARSLPHTFADPVVVDVLAGVLELAGILCLALELALLTEGAPACLAVGSVQRSPPRPDPCQTCACSQYTAQVPFPCFVAFELLPFPQLPPAPCLRATPSWPARLLPVSSAGRVVVVVLVSVYVPVVYACLVYDPAPVWVGGGPALPAPRSG